MSVRWLLPLLALALVVGAGSGAPAAKAGGLTVVVNSSRSAAGYIRVAVWRTPEGFLKPKAAILRGKLPAKAGAVRFTFQDLPPGRYAAAAFHDENGNGEFDRTWLGLPEEGLGFSNGARIGLGPPSFEAAAVELTGPRQVIEMTLRY